MSPTTEDEYKMLIVRLARMTVQHDDGPEWETLAERASCLWLKMTPEQQDRVDTELAQAYIRKGLL